MKIAAKMIFLNFKYLPIHDKVVLDCGIDYSEATKLD